MSTAISLRKATAATIRISRNAILTVAVAAALITFIGTIIGNDFITYTAGVTALAAIYSLDKKGGSR